jgi:hypothetical protein
MGYLFYHIYINIRKLPTNPAPGLSALAYLSLLEFANIMTIVVALNTILQLDLKAIPFEKQLYVSLTLCCILLITNYMYLFKRLDKLKAKFSVDNKSKRIIGILVFTIYTFFSIFLFCFIAYKYPFK